MAYQSKYNGVKWWHAVFVFWIIVTVFTDCNAQKSRSDLFEFTTRKLFDNVYVAYRPDPLRYFVEGNVTIIVNDADVILVDGGGSPESARNIIKEVRQLTKNPIRYVINTHDHVDHTFGNQVYLQEFPHCEIIAHPKCISSLLTSGSQYLKYTLSDLDSALKRGDRMLAQLNKQGEEALVKYWTRYRYFDVFKRIEQYRQVTITPATVATESMTIQRGKRTIEIRHIGWGDTPGDLIVYLPNEKIICSGDMLTHPVPYGFTTNPFEWISTLEKLSAFDFNFLVPGHGTVQEDKQFLKDVIEMIRSVEDQVKTGIQNGAPRDSIRAKIDVSKFAQKYSNADPVFHYRLKGWFSNPHAGVVFDSLKVKSGKIYND